MNDREKLLDAQDIKKMLLRLDLPAHCKPFVVGARCPSCGMVPLFRGHDCTGGTELREHCPACGKLLAHFKAGQLLFSAHNQICSCTSFCPFCVDCCKWLAIPVQPGNS